MITFLILYTLSGALILSVHYFIMDKVTTKAGITAVIPLWNIVIAILYLCAIYVGLQEGKKAIREMQKELFNKYRDKFRLVEIKGRWTFDFDTTDDEFISNVCAELLKEGRIDLLFPKGVVTRVEAEKALDNLIWFLVKGEK